ncbi:MAG: dihydroorotate dehydrogenase [Clostridiales bacterium]|nr:dihydroorotate dehydrogenase [Clostridiales bacterium]MBD9217510.1 dihydroorotate dehydrogenase [Clostridiales bacterium]
MSYLTDLSVELGGAVFKNPVMPASGTYDYFENNADCFPVSELGAVMIKSVHRLRRPGNPGPRIAEVCGGMLNCVGIPSVGIEAFLRDELPRYENIGTQVILSISGSEPVHYAEIAELVGDDPRIAALEMNLSCPNVGSGLPFSSDPQLLYDTVRQTRQRTTLPLYAKLSPNVTDIRVSCRAAEDAGADALTLSNTFRAMTIDIQKRRPYLGNLSGGMSGPAVKPMNMFLVWQAYETVHIPIIACGGIASWRDAVEYLMAGASAVQVGSCNFNDPMTMHNIIHDLDSYLHRNGIASVRELCGAAHKQ